MKASEFRELGFKVHGIHDLKFLRGELAKIKFKPIFFWSIISELSQKFTYYFPDLAFQLLAKKTLKKAPTHDR